MIEVTLFSRKDCHLCEQAEADLASLQASYPHHLAVIDIDSNPDLVKIYGNEVPVVETGPYRLKAPFSRMELQMTLSAAQDRLMHIDSVERSPALEALRNTWTRADGFTYWFSRHYMTVFNLFVLLYLGLPFLAPVLMVSGAPGPAGLIYRSYGFVCHQLSYRSFFLFGEQAVYPRAAAGVPGVLTFQQATGMSEGNNVDDVWAARTYVGNPAIGYKVALCERDILIYGGILLFGLLFAATGKRIPSLPWYLWVLIGLVPIGLDGVSQLLSQPPLSFLPYRESTPFLRSLTGFLFGFTTGWFGYPMVEESMVESRQAMALKFQRLAARRSGSGPSGASRPS